MEDITNNSSNANGNGQCPYFLDCGKLRVVETYANNKLREFKSKWCFGNYETCTEHKSKSSGLTQSLETK